MPIAGDYFEAELDLSAGTIKCNCSYCVKSRFWIVRTETKDFRASGEAKDYRGRNPVAHHFFSPQCGVHVYDRMRRQIVWAAPMST